MNDLSSDVTLLGGKTTGIATLPDEVTDKPVVVFVHGGGATARSFDYRLVEFDTLWTARPDLVDEFADALRTRSPYVDAALFPGSTHGIADSIAGHEYCLQVLGFTESCAAAVSTPQLLGR
ncbi:hypothetical protein ACFPIJ_29050 [Dactylosporangium cerinum]|uniref:Alpha/beta hydrolase n=1 Tax=Dactylosporangium cerinum TaxID=1434730 RepID=A0ABV9VZR5_9ACTN